MCQGLGLKPAGAPGAVWTVPQTHGHRAGGCDCRRMPEVFSGGVGISPSQGCSEHELMEETVRVGPAAREDLAP